MDRRFKYTQDNKAGSLTDTQKEFYEENGYIIIKDNVNHLLLEEASARFKAICTGQVDPGFIRLMKDSSLKQKGVQGEYLINKIHDFLFDEVLFKYASYKAVLDVVESIIGPNITGVHSMLINKPPDANPETSVHPLHQDLHYFPFRPEDSITASWTAMEKADEHNGCLFVIPGSHKAGELYNHNYPEDFKHKLYHEVSGIERHLPKVKNLIMEKGDTVFFHPLLLHGSGANRTKGFRKAISVHYADTNSYFIDVKGTIQEEMGLEVEKWARKGSPIQLIEVWRAKSRLIKGPPGGLQSTQSHL